MNVGWGKCLSGVWGRCVWVDGKEDCAHNLVVNWDSFSQGGHSLRVTQCAVRSRDTQRLSFSSLNRLWRRFWVSENYYNVTVVWQRRQRQDESSRDKNSLLSIPYELFLRNLQHRKGASMLWKRFGMLVSDILENFGWAPLSLSLKVNVAFEANRRWKFVRISLVKPHFN